LAVHVLAIDTTSDELTQACLDAREMGVYPHFADQSLVTSRLIGPAATGAALVATLTPETALLTASGHGLPDRLLGQSGIIIQAGAYPAAVVRHKIVHLLACECGENLGPDLVANGCRAFLGYREQFLFPASSPGDFLECDAVIDRALADGLTAADAFALAIRAFNRRIDELTQAGQAFRASLVRHNRNCLVGPSIDSKWGDPGAAI
jgi:hypothetical protein